METPTEPATVTLVLTRQQAEALLSYLGDPDKGNGDMLIDVESMLETLLA